MPIELDEDFEDEIDGYLDRYNKLLDAGIFWEGEEALRAATEQAVRDYFDKNCMGNVEDFVQEVKTLVAEYKPNILTYDIEQQPSQTAKDLKKIFKKQQSLIEDILALEANAVRLIEQARSSIGGPVAKGSLMDDMANLLATIEVSKNLNKKMKRKQHHLLMAEDAMRLWAKYGGGFSNSRGPWYDFPKLLVEEAGKLLSDPFNEYKKMKDLLMKEVTS
ncbi:hypothetical protein P2G88_12650 [Aliiglaciecola sp. CAU 1673]|uniref:hypothetical protein n=1 Tax=Aliiglaciecola sp. CAU 1673 TaxID=3032595 RepID=UPI0023DCACF5|nr:hypothetical protein [Aliiglaciecola sp. CAU 1673]MDF2179102.1 hypothetical protein [Aliiglaciecola sp. CAU 1673]